MAAIFQHARRVFLLHSFWTPSMHFSIYQCENNIVQHEITFNMVYHNSMCMCRTKFLNFYPSTSCGLRQHYLRANYLAYTVRYAWLKSLPFGHGWELVCGRSRSVGHIRQALPTHLPALESAEETKEGDRDDGDDDVVRRRKELSESCDSDSSQSECSESNSSYSYM